MAVPKYDQRTILLHWATAVLVLAVWASGQTIDWFPRGAIRIDARSAHFMLGALVAILTAYRIFWRRFHGRKFLATGGASAWMARAVKVSLYLLILATVCLGIYNLLVRGDCIFNLVSAPKIGPMTIATRRTTIVTVTNIHILCANLILVLAGGHAVAALFHRFVLKDHVFQRMWPSKD